MTGDAERRRRIDQLKHDLRLRRALDEEGRKLSADPKWQALQEHLQQLQSDPKWHALQEQLQQLQSDPEWRRQQEELREAAHELAREEMESPEPRSASLTASETASSGSHGVLGVSEGADTAAASGLVRTLGDLTAAEAADTAAFALPPLDDAEIVRQEIRTYEREQGLPLPSGHDMWTLIGAKIKQRAPNVTREGLFEKVYGEPEFIRKRRARGAHRL